MRGPNKSSGPAVPLENESEDEILIDNTESLPLRSKKTSRQKRKLDRKSKREAAKPHLLSLYPELALDILSYLRPSDIFQYKQTCRTAKQFVQHHETSIVKAVISYRYPILTQCFPRPVLLQNVDPACQPALLNERRQKMLGIHRRPYKHVQSHDPQLLCSCLTCVLAWNNLCVIVDLAYWTKTAISKRQPIPMMPRGQNPDWNIEIVEKHAQIVREAVTSPLRYASILQQHLETMIFSIRRYAPKDGTSSFSLDDYDVAQETDAFCDRPGPPSYEFPLHRDAYYELQAYLPNRGWIEGRWRYQPADQHLKDLKWVQEMSVSSQERRGGLVKEEDVLKEQGPHHGLHQSAQHVS